MIARKEIRCSLLQAAQRFLGYQPTMQEETRWRLLQAAAEVFADAGYRAATTREICRRAGVNLAAIHYHFGDKAELYREVFRLPFLEGCNPFLKIDVMQAALPDALRAFYEWFFPVVEKEDPMTRLFMRLHAREEAEPSGVLGDVITQAFRPSHGKMQKLLCRELGLKRPDGEVDRLTLALIGLATVYFHNRTAVETFASHLVQGKKAQESMVERLTEYAIVLIEAERRRRAARRVKPQEEKT